MKTIAPRQRVALLGGIVLMVVCLTMYDCNSVMIRKDGRSSTVCSNSASYTELTGEASVYRSGNWLQLSQSYRLQTGDIIQTGSRPGAVVCFPDGNGVILDAHTRVRLGSFFVEFGRILARVQGFFEVESENVIAGVEGTEFVFEVRPDRAVVVTVLRGIVVCRSRSDGWQVPLSPGEVLSSRYPNVVNPGKRPATNKELDDIRLWIQRINESSTPEEQPVSPSSSGGALSTFFELLLDGALESIKRKESGVRPSESLPTIQRPGGGASSQESVQPPASPTVPPEGFTIKKKEPIIEKPTLPVDTFKDKKIKRKKYEGPVIE